MYLVGILMLFSAVGVLWLWLCDPKLLGSSSASRKLLILDPAVAMYCVTVCLDDVQMLMEKVVSGVAGSISWASAGLLCWMQLLAMGVVDQRSTWDPSTVSAPGRLVVIGPPCDHMDAPTDYSRNADMALLLRLS
ncbi:hypothetical protein Nepgr_033831 [Nepenthes gracilis]|uniref:Uncharacterized protein n=1 Tax=Nepenthes gracilis TaxID=150966 RepID=A0AAD3TM49_NEPGR|nr:hypothetical protein Nepgr_033831 [Nepenthes gracilis]